MGPLNFKQGFGKFEISCFLMYSLFAFHQKIKGIVWWNANKECKVCWLSQSYSSLVIRGRLFRPVWSVWERRETSSSLSCLNCRALSHYTMIQPSGPGSRVVLWYPAPSRFHINPLEYLSSAFAEIIKALADPRSYCEGDGRSRKRRGSSAWLSRLTWDIWPLPRVIQRRPASAHLCLPPNEASRLGWDCRGAPPVARLTPCSSSVASQTPLVTRWDYKLPVLKA